MAWCVMIGFGKRRQEERCQIEARKGVGKQQRGLMKEMRAGKLYLKLMYDSTCVHIK